MLGLVPDLSLRKKWSFPLRNFLVNVAKSAVSCEEILNGKLHFLYSVYFPGLILPGKMLWWLTKYLIHPLGSLHFDHPSLFVWFSIIGIEYCILLAHLNEGIAICCLALSGLCVFLYFLFFLEGEGVVGLWAVSEVEIYRVNLCI